MAGILEKVKSALGITGVYQDETLKVYIDEVVGYMVSSGVPEAVANSKLSAGVVSRGVTDLWNYNGNSSKLSEYFYQRVAQLVYGVKDGKIITFTFGDYGISYPVYVKGLEIEAGDTLIFACCNGIVKEFTNVQNNCILVTFTEDESKLFMPNDTYEWHLKLKNKVSLATIINNGSIVVSC